MKFENNLADLCEQVVILAITNINGFLAAKDRQVEPGQ